mgnify:CR=1 FL=1
MDVFWDENNRTLPCSLADLNSWEREYELALPALFKELYAIHNGTWDDDFICLNGMYSIDKSETYSVLPLSQHGSWESFLNEHEVYLKVEEQSGPEFVLKRQRKISNILNVRMLLRLPVT